MNNRTKIVRLVAVRTWAVTMSVAYNVKEPIRNHFMHHKFRSYAFVASDQVVQQLTNKSKMACTMDPLPLGAVPLSHELATYDAFEKAPSWVSVQFNTVTTSTGTTRRRALRILLVARVKTAVSDRPAFMEAMGFRALTYADKMRNRDTQGNPVKMQYMNGCCHIEWSLSSSVAGQRMTGKRERQRWFNITKMAAMPRRPCLWH